MKTIVKIFILLLISTKIYSLETEENKPKIGLVLAGGGAWGFAHVGVLRIIEEEQIPISYITGTSIGAVIGSLYSMGYTVDELEDLIRSENWFNVLNDSIDREDISALNKNDFQDYILGFSVEDKKLKIPGGIVEGQKIDYLLTRLHWDAKDITDFNNLPIPFRCVATNIKSGEPVILSKGDITDSVRASMSIPGVFSPVKVEDDILVDGMFAMNLPVSAVKDMGADIVIAVNFDIPETGFADYTTLTGALFQSFLLNMNINIREEIPLADLIISPDISEYSTFSYDMADEIYQEGIKAANKKRALLKKYSDEDLFLEFKKRKLRKSRSVIIKNVEVLGVNKAMAKSIKDVAGFKKDYIKSLSNKELEKIIQNIYSLGLFDLVTYKIKGSKLIINIREKESNVLGVAMNYDLYDNVSLLLNLKSRLYSDINLFSDLNIKLGEKKEIRERISVNLGFINIVGLFSESNITLDKYPSTAVNHKESSFEARTTLGIGVSLSKYFLGTFSIGYDYLNFNDKDHNTLFLEGVITFDNLDQTIYPESGVFFQLTENWAIPTDIGTDYSRTLLKTLFVIPVIENKLSLLSGINGGMILKQDKLREALGIEPEYEIPVNQKIFVGGNRAETRNLNFIGYKRHEFTYLYSVVLNTGFQFKIFDSTYIQGKINLGVVGDHPENFYMNSIWSYGLFAGVVTPLGPLEASITLNKDYDFTFNLNLGYVF